MAFAIIALAIFCISYMGINPKVNHLLLLDAKPKGFNLEALITMLMMGMGMVFGIIASSTESHFKTQIFCDIILWIITLLLFIVQREISIALQLSFFTYFLSRGIRHMLSVPIKTNTCCDVNCGGKTETG